MKKMKQTGSAGRSETHAVAHFRTTIFDTFVYNYAVAQQSFTPVMITQAFDRHQELPFEHPIVELSRRSLLARITRKSRLALTGRTDTTFAVRRTYSALRKHRVAVLHAHFGPTGWDCLKVRRHAGLPLVTTFYGYDVSRLPRDPVWLERFCELFAEGERFLVEGPFMRSALAGIGCPAEKIHIQRNAINVAGYKVRQLRERHVDDSVVEILFCGRLTEKKGVRFALEAVREVVAAGYHIRLTIIGDGPEGPTLAAYAREAGILNHIRFLGAQPHHVVVSELGSADVFIHPSVTASDGDTEGGAPTILLEAQAAGIPIVSTMHADIPYIVQNGRSGFLSVERDSTALAKDLIELIRSPELRRQFGHAGRAFVESFHDARIEVKALESHYTDLHHRRSGHKYGVT